MRLSENGNAFENKARDSSFSSSLLASNMEFPFFQHFQFSSITFVIRICSLCSLIMKHFESRLISICAHISNNKLSFFHYMCMYNDNKENSSCELLSVYIRFQFFIGFLYDDDDDDCEYIIERQKKKLKWNYTKSSRAMYDVSFIYLYWKLITCKGIVWKSYVMNFWFFIK